MNIEVYTMIEDQEAINNNNDDNKSNEELVSEDGTNDTINDTNGNYDENAICIQELDESQVSIPDKKKIALYEKWIPFFADDGIELQEDKLVCTICRKQISADKKSRLTEHITSKKHRKMLEINPSDRPEGFEPYTPNTKRIKLSGENSSLTPVKTYSKLDSRRDKSHEILLADTLNLFVQLDVPFEKLNSDVWQSFVKKHVKNGDLILKNFTFYKTGS